jgi:alkanesulfonate monooxygenase SsuD/methylene tetrahydromethanopterin reductase-like flavin-dependent oxidoreductase (luciferase family)
MAGNKLKLGVFAFNLDSGFTATTVPERFRLNWDNVKDVAAVADRAGIEALIPLARWRGLGGETNFQGTNYETLTWAAGLGASTRRAGVFSTVHVPTIHPIVAAKQCTTIDHISGGRFGLNIVCGWNPVEFKMFGSEMLGHDARYEYAAEWIEIVRMLWTRDEPFDFEGKFFKIAQGVSDPKPLSKPHPAIMNAGRSPTGMRFAAKYADLVFQDILETDMDQTRARFAEVRRIGREDYQRSFEIWTSTWVVCRPTEKEAQDYYRYAIHEHGDFDALKGLPPELIPSADNTPPEVLKEFQYRALAGFGGSHLIGTPEQIVDKLKAFSNAGLDGMVLTFVDYQNDLRTFVRDVFPLLEQDGLRLPAAATAG